MGKILLLEDDSHYRAIIERVLSCGHSCRITSVTTEAQAWEELSKEDFDLVLLDLYIDGRRCWKTLKRVLNHPARPVAIVLSCEDTRRNEEYAVSLGAYAFLPKPINFVRLKMTVDSALHPESRGAPATSDPPGALLE